ncbi:hypothetical protein [Pseudoalteromonas denitrificans]|jgi:hypothetical protein|uniref:Uncharacterized protein n=1 Tax=Pseudoalteromonas denitrificans DSM 6059 TaxID=1123010 RepID=A0A1I1JAV7_9GAMM|nr:hypothetical protein [Pseudoalteromonas denitrificans]SFC45112.1 hypothetical protein SAMN02745724_01702 [Pseudoalteromonas denitrificans DSM 6059]
MKSKSQILGLKFIIVSITLLVILITDAHVFATLLNIKNTQNTSNLQLWGCMIVFGGIIAGCSLIKIKKIHYIHSAIYLIMAITFLFLPFLIIKSPYVLLEVIG